MKVDVRQIENAAAQMEKMLSELRCACEMLDEVSHSLRIQQVGSEETTFRIRASLQKERAILSQREEGLRKLSAFLHHAAHAYETCEKKAMKYSETNPWSGGIIKPSPQYITDFVSPVYFIENLERFILPLLGQEGR